MSHTPAPWRVGKYHGTVVTDVEHPGVWSDDDNKEAYGGFLVCESVHSEANARLIAAAPDLYAVAKALVVFQEHDQRNTRDTAPGNSYYASLLMDVVKQAQLTVALAEGRELPRHESTQPCGCDPGAKWVCEQHRTAVQP